MKIYAFFFLWLLCSCTTYEKYTYFTPENGAISVSGPKGSGCAYRKDADGLSDRALVNISGYKTEMVSSYKFEPYFWGPLFVPPVIPIYPATWLINNIIDNNLEVSVYNQAKIDFEMIDISIVANLTSRQNITLVPKAIRTNSFGSTIYFSVNADKVESFILRMNEEIQVFFKKTNRWAYSGWSINC